MIKLNNIYLSHMMNWKTITLIAMLTSLSGCSIANRLVYRIDVNQGNFIDQSVVQDLRFGMNKDQIQYVLGPPTIVDPSQPDLWYYIHWLKPGHDEPEQKTLILEFDSAQRLANLRGDFIPEEGFFEL